MKNKIFSLLTALLFFVTSFAALAEDVYVNGYTRSNGTYVQPHYRSAPDSTRNNNFSTQGNVNPYTGETGSRPRDNGSAFGSGNTNSAFSNSLNNSGGGLYGGSRNNSSGSSLYGE